MKNCHWKRTFFLFGWKAEGRMDGRWLFLYHPSTLLTGDTNTYWVITYISPFNGSSGGGQHDWIQIIPHFCLGYNIFWGFCNAIKHFDLPLNAAIEEGWTLCWGRIYKDINILTVGTMSLVLKHFHTCQYIFGLHFDRYFITNI